MYRLGVFPRQTLKALRNVDTTLLHRVSIIVLAWHKAYRLQILSERYFIFYFYEFYLYLI